MNEEEYTDETIMSFGKHKGKAFANVPAGWFIWAYDNIKNNPKLTAYIKKNLDAFELESRKGKRFH